MNNKVFVIAEAGVGIITCINIAKEVNKCKQKAGADAIKFQTYISQSSFRYAPKAEYQNENTLSAESQLDM